jgi:hypothetical protein
MVEKDQPNIINKLDNDNSSNNAATTFTTTMNKVQFLSIRSLKKKMGLKCLVVFFLFKISSKFYQDIYEKQL